ncbi:N-acetyltransferase [Streptomyces sp. SL13]|uniref:N-acetyltransferase n=1 Tax=Streptantibioticus silvisoli TaxID=2705255 RepID=A0AA90H776_9ACTN|nr:N-acetyltransferase [Streptantibioticus silvisoli]MDI5962616.1 N-acetyltransferase [Streptantibioticus silvisoli]MDI5969247.1 N-acetyltransferase [Streptantibioticus silvisoli]
MTPPHTSAPPIAVRRAAATDRDAVARLIGEAFMRDPVSEWVFPDEEQRRAVHPAFFGVFLDAALRDGWVDVTGDLTAAALWMPVGTDGAPQSDAAGDEAFARRLAEAGGTERGGIVGELTAAAHPSQPHYYLPIIGALPGHRDRGLGRALITHVTDRCDREGVAAYLEASNPRSRLLYERLGFVFTGTSVDLPGGPSLWPMWRAPRT